jgi:predicted transposase YdaD
MDETVRRNAAVAESRAEGEAIGMAKGRAAGKLEMVKQMLLSNLDVETISKVSGMPVEEIKALK